MKAVSSNFRTLPNYKTAQIHCAADPRPRGRLPRQQWLVAAQELRPHPDLLGENWRRVDNPCVLASGTLKGAPPWLSCSSNIEGFGTWRLASRGGPGRSCHGRTRPGSRPKGLVAALEETWVAIETALRNGCRGLPGGSSLAKVLAEHRGLRRRGRPAARMPE